MPSRFFARLAPLALLVLAGCGESSRVVEPGAPPIETLPASFSVRYDSTLGTPAFMYDTNASGVLQPGVPAPYRSDEAFLLVRQFVVNHAPVFQYRVGLDDFVVTTSLGGNGQNTAKMQQTYRGLPVNAMGYAGTVIAGGQVVQMNGRFMPNIMVSTLPLFHESKVAPVAELAVRHATTQVVGAPSLVITTYDDVPRLAWAQKVANVNASWMTWTVYVDATDGQVLGVGENFILN